jgi:hypothetical protein
MGICSYVAALRFDRPPYHAVVKVDPENATQERRCETGTRAAEHHLLREWRNLEFVRQHTNLPVPEVYWGDCTCQTFLQAYLLLQKLPGQTLQDLSLETRDRQRIETELAEVLLELHAFTRDSFGDFGQAPGTKHWADVMIPRLLSFAKVM